MSRILNAWRRIGPTRAISPNVLGAVSIARPWPEAGASTITRSYVRFAASQRSSCASSQTFAIVISSFAPGAAATKCWNADEPVISRSAVPAELARQPLLQRRGRVDADRPQVLGQLDLLLAPHALAGERARDAVLLGDLADDRAPPALRRRQPERRRDRRLADAALARDVQQRAV